MSPQIYFRYLKMVTPKFLNCHKLDAPDDLVNQLEKAFNKVQGLTSHLSQQEANEILNSQVSKGVSEHEEVQLAKLYSILMFPNTAEVALRDMLLVNRDKYNVVISRVSELICEKWKKLQDHVKSQIVWLVTEFVSANIPATDVLCHHLVRQVAGGDISLDNLWLSESLLELFTVHRPWLEKITNLLAVVLFTYLRIIADHMDVRYHERQKREVSFCISILREKFDDCMVIGRDLVRLLQNVATIPEFEQLWVDILYNPSKLSPNFTGLEQLMKTRTSRQFLASRITPDMERKLHFMTSQVRFGEHKKYQEWFQSQYLATLEGQSLRSDLIRFICTVIHPTNEILASGVLPRWALIGWLLTTCTSNVASANAKLALFYDYLFFSEERQSIMDIEPAILLIHHSMKQYATITVTLLDFLCRIVSNFHPPLTDQIKKGIDSAFSCVVSKGVIDSLTPLLQNRRLDKELRKELKLVFPKFSSTGDTPPPAIPAAKLDKPSQVLNENMVDARTNVQPSERFSDDELDIDKEIGENGVLEDDVVLPQRALPSDISNLLSGLSEVYKTLCHQLKDENDVELECELVQQIVVGIMEDENFTAGAATDLAVCFGELLRRYLQKQLFPEKINEDSIEESTSTPIFVVFRTLAGIVDMSNRQPILLFVHKLYKRFPQVGYYLLYFLKVTQQTDRKMEVYSQFCAMFDEKTTSECLRIDLLLCAEDDPRLFAFLLPDIYTEFPDLTCGNGQLVRAIVSTIDSTQLQELICQILQGHLVMFKKEFVGRILADSLQWESIEQHFLWQLICAHQLPTDCLLSVLPRLKFGIHPEALSNILLCLKHESPNNELLKSVLCRENNDNDTFVISILRWWAHKFTDRLADLLFSLITRMGTGSPRKRSRTHSGRTRDLVSTDQVIAHLEEFRKRVKNVEFLMHESIQSALLHFQKSCSEAQKSKFSDLLALVDEDLQPLVGPPKRTRSRSSPKPSSRHSSDSDEPLQKAKKKKKKKTTPTTPITIYDSD